MHIGNYRSNLSKYFNTGCLTRSDKLTSLLFPALPFYLNSDIILNQHKIIHNQEKTGVTLQKASYNVSVYQGNNPHVLEMMSFIDQNLKNELKGAYLHGSLSTGEEISYSDFDGLLILKSDVFRDSGKLRETAIKISNAYSLMIHFDPLQHHGWFILSENELNNFPTDYFPPVLFEFCKSLLRNNNEIQLSFNEKNPHNKSNLDRLISSVLKKCNAGSAKLNMYSLKSILSEFLLLPSLYLQAKNGHGIFKKFSFDEASKDFSTDIWSIMNEVSEIRKNWEYIASWKLLKYPVIVSPWLKREQAARAGAIPPFFRNQLTDDFFNRMKNLSLQFGSKFK